MKVRLFPDSHELAQEVASLLAKKLETNGDVGFATGKTMDPVYKLLESSPPSSIKARAWMLDEYLGLPKDDPRTYSSYLQKKVFGPLRYPSALLNLPNMNLGPAEAAAEYERKLSTTGGLSVQLLGIGHNGHVGLNEPGSTATSRTRVVDIAHSTRAANTDGFSSLAEVPSKALTLGIANLMEAHELWLLAIGAGKAEIIKKLVQGGVTSEVPASFLKEHKNFTVFVDAAAASLL